MAEIIKKKHTNRWSYTIIKKHLSDLDDPIIFWCHGFDPNYKS